MGQWAVGSGQWAVGSEQWTVDRRRWTVKRPGSPGAGRTIAALLLSGPTIGFYSIGESSGGGGFPSAGPPKAGASCLRRTSSVLATAAAPSASTGPLLFVPPRVGVALGGEQFRSCPGPIQARLRGLPGRREGLADGGGGDGQIGDERPVGTSAAVGRLAGAAWPGTGRSVPAENRKAACRGKAASRA